MRTGRPDETLRNWLKECLAVSLIQALGTRAPGGGLLYVVLNRPIVIQGDKVVDRIGLQTDVSSLETYIREGLIAGHIALLVYHVKALDQWHRIQTLPPNTKDDILKELESRVLAYLNNNYRY